jgi:alpha-galactosidase
MKLLISILLSLIFNGLNSQDNNTELSKIVFNKKSGRYSVEQKNSKFLIENASASAITKSGVYTTEKQNYSYKTRELTEPNGNNKFIVEGKDINGKLDFKQIFTFYKSSESFSTEIIYKNVSKNAINILGIQALRLVKEERGIFHWNNASHCLTNGAMYYDAGNIQPLDKPWIRPKPYGETKGGVISDTFLTKNPFTAQSWWNITLFGSKDQNSLTAGYLLNANTLGRIQVLKNDEESLSMIAESVLNPGFELLPGKEISSDEFVLVTGTDKYESNSIYAEIMKGKMKNPDCQIVNGWCNWFYSMDIFSEDEILANAVFASKYLKDYGLEYIQIDEGFQRAHGEWQGNSRFPHGLKWLCDSIRHLGLKPGIWISPFVISETTDIFQNHKDWLLKDTGGNPIRIGPWPSENTDWYRDEVPKRYCLDITHPEAEKWYRNLIDTIANSWGFEMIKLDFVAWTVFSAHHFYRQDATPAQVYRHALKIMRDVAGNDCHILDCGPGHVSGGYINSMRIEYDQNYGYSDNAWAQYFKGYSCSSGAQGKRWFYNNKTWTNDIDHVCIDLLSENEAKAVATIIGLSGGNVMSGDRLLNMDQTKLNILTKIFPSTSENAIPMDLLENDPQTLFKCQIIKNFGRWDLFAFFNPDRKNQLKRDISLKNISYLKDKTYLIFDFWNEKFIGETTDTVSVSINPGSAVLLSVREKSGIPQIIGTNRHVKMGAVEIADEKFSKESKTLSVVSQSPIGSSHSVFVYIPEAFDWEPLNSKIYDYRQNFTIRKVEQNILRIDINFENSEEVKWQIQFKL